MKCERKERGHYKEKSLKQDLTSAKDLTTMLLRVASRTAIDQSKIYI